jgi:hypothetical protein
MLVAGNLRATVNGQPVQAQTLPQNQIGVANFYLDVTLGESEEGYASIARGLSVHRATGSVTYTAFAVRTTEVREALNAIYN